MVIIILFLVILRKFIRPLIYSYRISILYVINFVYTLIEFLYYTVCNKLRDKFTFSADTFKQVVITRFNTMDSLHL